MAGRRGDVARVLRLADEKLAHGVFETPGHAACCGRPPARCVTIFASETFTSSWNCWFFFSDVGQQLDQLALEPRQARRVVVERELVGDRPLGVRDILHQPAEGGVLFVQRKLFDDHVDLRLQSLADVAVIGGELADQPRKRAFLVVERELLEQVIALLRQLIVDAFAQRGQQAIGLLRVEQLHQRAVAADVRDQRAGEQRVLAVDEALDELRELAVVGHAAAARGR